jgi:hypothetical protein
VPERRQLSFEIGASVILVGKDLQFGGLAKSNRVRFIISNDALKRLSGLAELTHQQKFKTYDRNRGLFQDVARRLYDGAEIDVKIIKIAATDL